MKFEIIIEDKYVSKILTEYNQFENKNDNLLSMINDFEDGAWRYKKFKDYVFDKLMYTALTKEEREKLIDDSMTRLSEGAKKLKLPECPDKKGGEIGEILLYGIMNDYYKACSIVPKIFYKQNKNDYAKGADSVHIVIENDDFSIWLGESKFYTTISGAIDNAIKSVGDTLTRDKLKKENSIITNLHEFEKYEETKPYAESIKNLLSGNTSIDNLKPKLHIPIILLHECTHTQTADCLSEEYKEQIKTDHFNNAKSYFSKQKEKLRDIHLIDTVTFHLILFPVPDKQRIVDAFYSTAKMLGGE